MADTVERKYGLGDFFAGFMGNIGSLILVNIMFCIPLAAFTALLWLISCGENINIFLVFLLIPFMSPFFAGVVNVCRKVSADKKARPIKDFFGGIKNNWKFFLVNSVLLYILSVSIWAVSNYFSRQAGGFAAIVFLIIMIASSVLFVFIDLSAIVMAVSVELSFAEIIRNSIIMVMSGFANHLKTMLSLIFTASVVYSIVVLTGEPVISLIILDAIVVLLLPVTVIYIIVYNSYQTVEKLVIKPYQKQEREKIRDRIEKENDEKLTVEELEPLAKGDPEEYVFLNGKTVKRKNIIKMIEVRKNRPDM